LEIESGPAIRATARFYSLDHQCLNCYEEWVFPPFEGKTRSATFEASNTVIRPLTNAHPLIGTLLGALALVMAGTHAHAQTATNITGLYFTGLASNGSLGAGGTKDANWNVTYASTNGGTSASASHEGAAYVINPSVVSGSGYTPNTNAAQWITAPGATIGTGGAANAGGDYLPGNGNTGSNEGIYVYTLAFTITGTGPIGTTVSSQIQITMTMAADDQYSVYVNPAGNGTTNPTGTASASQTSAWSNTSQIALQNYGPAGANNSHFVIGTNYIVIVVDNTNSQTGSSASTASNASGLLVYQTAAAEINGQPVVPEVATWLPLLGVVGCYGLVLHRRREVRLRPVPA
jgi:hypothetical protein